jgi:hypothetical protein
MMTAALKTKLTADEYLTIERKAEFRSEFHNGEMFAMVGASHEHCLAKNNAGSRSRLLTQGPSLPSDDQRHAC